MDEVSIVGVDLAKQVLQVHGAAADGHALFRKKLSRQQFTKFMTSLPPCVVAMEACGKAHYWGRELAKAGHEVRLIPPVYVKPFVKRQKNDPGSRGDTDGFRPLLMPSRSDLEKRNKYGSFREVGLPS